ncbi:MAG TPA: 3-oxoacid CoA-transferase subunit B [Bacteroidales bacterium]|nr:3-oxoacid CoA-transferase subunit B [Bacteroidales bacterium]HOS19778.1 3-oxoacid CoA-transferase subunit B [Bacteroidales bacterium]HPL03256.1 3-oxoacid CoA-transferase subunit B [Bacteroidales bacterium]HRR52892.1 3-oxoacid CoA-transferase subunit B [Bacteroidales bacterium]HRS68648.1 3-oxoacid CoA-transferase subunit B [Bacteroidales bacterium]
MDRINIGWSKEEMAKLVANDIPDGSYVNLGIGIPELIANYVPQGREVIIHTENGLLGVGPAPAPGSEDFDLINAGKKPITAIKGACFFHHADSFAMIRGGHLDFTILGAYQVSQNGDLANWSTGSPNDIPAVGGAMDLVQGVKNVFVIMSHTTKDGNPKIVKKCSYPLTGIGVVSRIYTDLAIIDVTKQGLKVIKLSPGIDKDTIINKTEAELIF